MNKILLFLKDFELGTKISSSCVDLGYSIENIAILCAIYTAISIFIVIIFQNSYKPTLINK